MSDHTYRVVELVGTSPNGINEAVTNAISRAQSTLRDLDWFEVTEIRGHIADGTIGHYQVSVKVGFKIEAPDV